MRVLSLIGVLAFAFAWATTSHAEIVYDGIFAEGHQDQQVVLHQPWNAFHSQWQAIEKSGYRLVDFEVHTSSSAPRFSGVFEPGTYAPAACIGKPWSEFHATWQSLEAKGYRMIDLETWQVGGQRVYGGVFEPGTYKFGAYVGKPWNDFHAQWQKFEQQGLRLFDFETYVEGNQRLYAGLFKPGSYSPAAFIGKPWNEFHAQWKKFEDQNYQLLDFEAYKAGNEWRYAGIFHPSAKKQGSWIAQNADSLNQMRTMQAGWGRGLIDLEVRDVAKSYTGNGAVQMAEVDALVVKWLADNKLPGATVAVSKQGRLVWSKGYGYADATKNIRMQPTHRSGIGSVSKVITAIGAMKLAQEQPQKFSLDSKIYGTGGLLPDVEYVQAAIEGIQRFKPQEDWLKWYGDMRVKHLLSHTSGFLGSGDNAGAAKHYKVAEKDVTYRQVHMFVLKGLRTKDGEYVPPVTFAPGTSSDYTNHGMGLMGHIITETSGQKYEDFVRTRVLQPLKLTDIVPLGHNMTSLDAMPHKYGADGNSFSSYVPDPARSIAAGGWASSAQNLVALACATDQLANQPDILPKAALQQMETPPFPAAPSRGLGWQIGAKGKLSHNGKLGSGGTATLAKFPPGYVSNDGIDLSHVNVAICVNISTDSSLLSGLASQIAKLCGAAQIPASYNLFAPQAAVMPAIATGASGLQMNPQTNSVPSTPVPGVHSVRPVRVTPEAPSRLLPQRPVSTKVAPVPSAQIEPQTRLPQRPAVQPQRVLPKRPVRQPADNVQPDVEEVEAALEEPRGVKNVGRSPARPQRKAAQPAVRAIP